MLPQYEKHTRYLTCGPTGAYGTYPSLALAQAARDALTEATRKETSIWVEFVTTTREPLIGMEEGA